jgi:predicted amidohydrolase YtcJ
MAARLTAVAVALIVGVTLVAGLIVGAQRDDDTGPIDLLIYNGRVYTGEGATPFAEALAIRGNRIYRVGSNREIKRLRRLATTVIDAHGGSVLSGFSDAHARLPIGEARDTEPADTAEASPAVSGPATPADASARTHANLLEEAVEGAHRLGVTSLNTIAETPDEVQVYEAAQRDASLPLRIVAAIRVEPPVDAATLAKLDALRAAHADDPLFRTDAVALKVTPAEATTPRRRPGRPAAAAEPMPPALPAETERALVEFDRRGWTIVLQAEDTRALSAAIDALAHVAKTNPAPAGGRRHRIEIARPMPMDLARVKALSIAVALPLPAVGLPGAILVDAVATAGDDVTTDADAHRSDELHGGIRLLMASESLADPRLGLQALTASDEPSSDATTDKPVDEASLAAAINAYTRTAAWASGDERRRGTITRHMLADIVIFSADLFALPNDKLLDAQVTMTIFDGKVVYDREADTPHTEP